MQTKEQFITKVEELIKSQNELILEKANKMYLSGCIDPDNYLDNYELPKAFMAAVCKDLAKQWQPLTKHLKKESDNIYIFI